MSDFVSRTKAEVIHADGWYYTVEEYDDGLLRVIYSEPDELGGQQNAFEGLWPESARKVGRALIALADEIEAKPEVKDQHPEYVKGFYAGIAWSHVEDTMFEAAKTS